HHRTTGRTGGTGLSIAESPYEALPSVDTATRFRKKHGLSLAACPPQHLPLLEEVLPLFVNAGGVRLSIQPKADCVEEAIALIRRFGAAEVVGFNDRNREYMSKVKAPAPIVPVF